MTLNTRTATPPTVRPIEVVTPIKPSEAIRLGCLIAPVQSFNGFGHGRSACAEGAIIRAFGGDDGYGSSPAGSSLIQAMDRAIFRVPCPDHGCDRSGACLPHLNDDHRWSRERIADWLEGLGL